MAIPSFTGLQTALSGIEAAQAELDTTGQNIANESTPGYSRQQVVIADGNSLPLPAVSSTTGRGAQLGEGVSIAHITRVRDQFLDAQYRAQNSNYNNSSTLHNILDQVQTALGESDGTGLSTTLNKFWSAWTSLSQNPTSTAAQQAVVSSGASVASTLSQLSQQLDNVTGLQAQVQSQFNALTAYNGDPAGDTVNGPVASDASQIAQLNTEIVRAQASGQTPNNLLDQRDQLIDDLSQYATVSVNNNTDGSVTVYFGDDATPGNRQHALVGLGVTDPSGSASIPSGVDFTDNLVETNLDASAGGQLGALKSLYDYDAVAGTATGTLVNYTADLDGVANDIATTVNDAISNADASGASAPPFFTGTTAATIAVNTAQIAFSSSTAPYTATEASFVAGLGDGSTESALNAPAPGPALGETDPNEAYNGLVTQIGSDVQSASSNQTTQQSLLTAINNQRESASGVSLNEELTNLITFQQAYQASARMMTVIDNTLQTLISMGASAGM